MARMYENSNERPKEIELLNVCEAVAYQIMHTKDCPTIKMGKRMVVPRDDFWDFLMAHKGIQLW